MSEYRIVQNELGEYGIQTRVAEGADWRLLTSIFGSWTTDLNEAQRKKKIMELDDLQEKQRKTIARIIE